MILVFRFMARGQGEVALTEANKQLDIESFEFHRNLDMVLLETIDKLLKRNRITLLSLEKVSIEGDIEQNSLAYTIAKTCAEAIETMIAQGQ